MQIAEAADHPFSRMGAYVSIGTLCLGKGVQRAIPMLEQGLALGEVADIRVFPHPPWALSHAHTLSGRVAEALQQLEQAHVELSTAIELYRAMDMNFWLPKAEDALAQGVGVRVGQGAAGVL